MVTYPADKSREAMPTLSPRAWGEREMRKGGKQGAIRAVAGKMGSTAFYSTVHSAFILFFILRTTKLRDTVWCSLALCTVSCWLSLVTVATLTASVPRIHKWIIQQWYKWEIARKKGRLGGWYSWVMSFWVSAVIIDISSGFSVFENHSKSRLQPDGHPCNHSSNSICSVIERHVLCLPACLKNDTQHWYSHHHCAQK